MKHSVLFQVKLAITWVAIALLAAPVTTAGTIHSFPSFSGNSAGSSENEPALPSLRRHKIYSDSSAQIVIDKQTGEIIKGNMLLLGTGKVKCDNLQLDIHESDPTMYTSRIPSVDTTVQPVTLGQVVTALLTLSVKPAEIIDILKSLIQEGVLQAHLVVQ